MPYTQANDPNWNTLDNSAPAKALASVTLSDTVDLPKYAKSLKCNSAGTIFVLPTANYRAGDETARRLVVNLGEYVPVEVARVFLTGTTVPAADIIAMLNG